MEFRRPRSGLAVRGGSAPKALPEIGLPRGIHLGTDAIHVVTPLTVERVCR
jgi:hypothetical protein